MKMIEFDDKENKPYDILIRQVGYESCLPSYRYGPHVRQHYLIHYIKKGNGIFRYKDKEIDLFENEMFLIYPNEVTYYEADDKKPWEYYWFGFEGTCSEAFLTLMGFSREARKVKFNLSARFSVDRVIKELSDRRVLRQSDRIYETAKLYEIFSWLIKNRESINNSELKNHSEPLLAAAVEYIRRSYMLDIKIEDIANHIGVDRTQLYRYFVKGMNTSPQKYLIDTRMQEACRLLKSTEYKIKQIAYSVGYPDEYLFSKMFKRRFMISPMKYRENNK